MTLLPHKVNGRWYGAFYSLDSGKVVYMAHRKKREIFRMKNAWTIDLHTLNECKARGIEAVGVITKTARSKSIYLTNLEDFFGPHSFSHFGETRQRGLPLARFRINPTKTAGYISTAIRLR